MKKNKPPLTAPVPVNVQRGRSASSGLCGWGKAEGRGVTSSMWIFHFPQPGPVGTEQRGGNRGGIDGVLYVCQFNTRRSNGAHIESCCVCIINMCVGVYVAQRPNMELTLIRESDGNLLTSFWTTCRCD